MSNTEESNIVHTCSFCGASEKDERTDCMMKASDDTVICNRCVRIAEAIMAERERDAIPLYRIINKINQSTEEKLRPITRIPKRWVICKVHLQKLRPCITACSPDGKKFETFSIPKQLAHWMISPDEEIDLDKIRKDIKKDIINAVTEELLRH